MTKEISDGEWLREWTKNRNYFIAWGIPGEEINAWVKRFTDISLRLDNIDHQQKQPQPISSLEEVVRLIESGRISVMRKWPPEASND